DDSHRADLGQPHAADALAEEDDEVCEGERGQAGEACEEHINVAWEIGEAALAHETAQLRRIGRSQRRRDRAQGIAQDANAPHVYVTSGAQVLDGCAYIQRLSWAEGGHAGGALAMADEVEEQCAIAAPLVQPRDLLDPLAAVIVDPMTTDEGAAVARRQIPSSELTARPEN